MLPRVILLLAVAAAALATTKEQYCKLCDTHTMCQNAGVNATNCKKGRFSRGLTSGNIATILDSHNRVRNVVASGAESRGKPGPQPAASNMEKLRWNQELADVAQRWADQCDWGHDKCRKVPGLSVGQNLFMTSGSPCSSVNDNRMWDDAVNSWYNEVKDFDKNTVNKYEFSAKTGHYTQVVWANTNQVGCGFTLYQDGEWCKKYYVCNYGPAGNYIGQPMYKQGGRRSACPKKTAVDPKYPALC